MKKRGNNLLTKIKGGKKMFQIISKNRKMLFFTFVLIAFLFVAFSANSFGMQYYEKLDFVTGLVTANTLNVRSGPRNKL